MNKKESSANSAGLGGEYSRILTAAVVNSRFRNLLLSNPDLAISGGFAGEVFNLGSEEKRRITSIRASSLADFARQLTQAQINRLGCAAD